MPPNLLIKAGFVRGELENVAKSGYDVKEAIRTDFILKNIFSYSIRMVFSFDAVRAINDKEEHVFKELKETYDAFLSNYGDNIKGLCSEIDVTQETVCSVLHGVSNELFCEGITWSRIIALFAFVGELTLQCLSRKYPDRIVFVIYECFCQLINEKLKNWIDDHGGWEDLTRLSVTQQGNINSLESSKSSNPPGWAKSLLHKTVQVIGTLAHIANSSNNALP